jgi:hypothetical protein
MTLPLFIEVVRKQIHIISPPGPVSGEVIKAIVAAAELYARDAMNDPEYLSGKPGKIMGGIVRNGKTFYITDEDVRRAVAAVRGPLIETLASFD